MDGWIMLEAISSMIFKSNLMAQNAVRLWRVVTQFENIRSLR